LEGVLADQLSGLWRRFGACGAAYLVIGKLRDLDDGDALMEIWISSIDKVEAHRLSAIRNDPPATLCNDAIFDRLEWANHLLEDLEATALTLVGADRTRPQNF
jgi:hypothetical protein